jgi:regulator of replication initiation timing
MVVIIPLPESREMIDALAQYDASTVMIGGSVGLTGLAFALRFFSRMFHGEKRDTAIDNAGASVYEILTRENTRMAAQMMVMSNQLATMSTQLLNLSAENHKLNMHIEELTNEIKQLRNYEQEQADLNDAIKLKNERISDLEYQLSRCERRNT